MLLVETPDTLPAPTVYIYQYIGCISLQMATTTLLHHSSSGCQFQQI